MNSSTDTLLEGIFKKMKDSLNTVDVPEYEDAGLIAAFEDELFFIFIEGAMQANTETTVFNKFKRRAPLELGLHPDKLASVNTSSRFHQNLKMVPHSIQDIPVKLLGNVPDLALDLDSDSPMINKIIDFWLPKRYKNFYYHSEEEKKRVDNHNERLFLFFLRWFDSSLLNFPIDLFYRYYAYPSFMKWVLYHAHALLNGALLTIIGLSLLALFAFRVLADVWREIEESFLFVLTANYYYQYIEEKAIVHLIEEHKELLERLRLNPIDLDENARKKVENAGLSPTTPDESLPDIARVLLKESIQNKTLIYPNKSSIEVKKDTISRIAENNGALHLQYVVESILLSILHTFDDDINIQTILVATLRLFFAVPIVLVLTYPVIFAEISMSPLLLVEAGVILTSMLSKCLFSFITALPGFLYGTTPKSDVTVKSAAGKDVLHTINFLPTLGLGFFSDSARILRRVVPKQAAAYVNLNLNHAEEGGWGMTLD